MSGDRDPSSARDPLNATRACAVADALLAGMDVETADVRAAVKWTLEQLAGKAPGRSVELRVPPYAAVQVIPGVVHRRGTPPALVECDARTWLALACGRLAWHEVCGTPELRASGERSDLSAYLPLIVE